MSSPQNFWSAITDTPQPPATVHAFAGALFCRLPFVDMPAPLKEAVTRMHETYEAARNAAHDVSEAAPAGAPADEPAAREAMNGPEKADTDL